MFYSIQSIAEYLRRKSRPASRASRASRASSGKSSLTETNPVASVPSEFFVNGHTPHFPGDTCSQSVIGRFGPAPVGASKSEEQTLGYLLGTKMEYQPHTLSYRLDDRGASQLKELFPETWAMFERGLADGHRIRESARGG